ncbi:hypothetical protein HDU96_001117 [Phlyctochytrium bullatum]|nr:hypothetical protein HDU96_001117 [Phlyctochytrium bullatum]
MPDHDDQQAPPGTPANPRITIPIPEDPTTPLLTNNRPTPSSRSKTPAGWSRVDLAKIFGANLLLIAPLAVVVYRALFPPNNQPPTVLFAVHVVAMAAFLVGLVNGILLLALAPPPTRKHAKHLHALIKLITLLSLLLGFIAITLNKIYKHRSPQPSQPFFPALLAWLSTHYRTLHGFLGIVCVGVCIGMGVVGAVVHWAPHRRATRVPVPINIANQEWTPASPASASSSSSTGSSSDTEAASAAPKPRAPAPRTTPTPTPATGPATPAPLAVTPKTRLRLAALHRWAGLVGFAAAMLSVPAVLVSGRWGLKVFPDPPHATAAGTMGGWEWRWGLSAAIVGVAVWVAYAVVARGRVGGKRKARAEGRAAGVVPRTGVPEETTVPVIVVVEEERAVVEESDPLGVEVGNRPALRGLNITGVGETTPLLARS